eukprot:5823297-Pyramimonas_sp.AAC.1
MRSHLVSRSTRHLTAPIGHMASVIAFPVESTLGPLATAQVRRTAFDAILLRELLDTITDCNRAMPTKTTDGNNTHRL